MGFLPLAVLLAAGCVRDHGPLALVEEGELSKGSARAVLTCQADLRGGTLQCAATEPSAAGAAGVIIGGQGEYLFLAADNVVYDEASGTFSADVTVQNLLTLAIGTEDGETPDPAGIRVFFLGSPQVTGGTGEISLRNPHGQGIFTKSGQAYFQYNKILRSGQRTDPITWIWDISATVETFSFQVGVDASMAPPVVPEDGGVRPALNLGEGGSVSAGGTHTCAVSGTGQIYCWGSGNWGQFYTGRHSGDRYTPLAVRSGESFRSVTTGGYSTCGVTIDGAGFCWGDINSVFWSGDIPVLNGVIFHQISAGPGPHACAITEDGSAYCWGDGRFGQLGDGDGTNKNAPTAVYIPAEISGVGFASISTGGNHTCALTADGAAYCWGFNSVGQLGSYSGDQTTPIAVTGGLEFTQLTAGYTHTCALTKENDAYCWGYALDGRLGNGQDSVTFSSPQLVSGGHKFSAIDAGHEHTCALTTDGEVYCWGNGGNGRLGNGQSENQTVPVRASLPADERFTSVSAGMTHSCAVSAGGAVYCWGENRNGRLGLGRTGDMTIPTVVFR